jgi:hypothetical protein
MALDLGQFKIQKAVFEIRFAQSFLIWDRTGHVWHGLRAKFPGLKLKGAQPNQQSFSLGEGLNATLTIENAHLAGTNLSSDLEPFISACDAFFPLVIKELNILDLSRIGFRIFHERAFPSKKAAADFMLSEMPQLKRSGKHFNIEGEQLDLDIALRWEGPVTGVLTRLHTVQRKIETEIPAEFAEEAKPINAERNLIILDADYYAHGNTSVSKFNPKALVESWSRAIRRDSIGFIHG